MANYRGYTAHMNAYFAGDKVAEIRGQKALERVARKRQYAGHPAKRTHDVGHAHVAAALLTDIYAAREKNTIGISSKDLLKKIRDRGQEAYHYSYFDDIENHILLNVSEGDLVMTIGAGDVYKVGEHILGEN